MDELFKFALKHTWEIALSAGMLWQGYEISELQNKNKETEIR